MRVHRNGSTEKPPSRAAMRAWTVYPNLLCRLRRTSMILPAEGDFRLEDEAATARLGAAVAKALAAGEAVCLWGPLGAGKSTLARGLIRALTSPQEEVPSPTFTLVQFYETPHVRLAH